MSDNLELNDVVIPKTLKFFILEDTPLFQKKMVQSLNDLGFSGSITISETLRHAIENFEKVSPDFFLSDWNLPDGVGIDFLIRVREIEKFKNTPFLMVTTIDDIDNILEAINSGADGYIVKPWTEEDIIEKIAFAYNKHSL